METRFLLSEPPSRIPRVAAAVGVALLGALFVGGLILAFYAGAPALVLPIVVVVVPLLSVVANALKAAAPAGDLVVGSSFVEVPPFKGAPEVAIPFAELAVAFVAPEGLVVGGEHAVRLVPKRAFTEGSPADAERAIHAAFAAFDAQDGGARLASLTARSAAAATANAKRPLAVYAVAAVIAATFVLELARGSLLAVDGLAALGAARRDLVVDQREIWRLCTAPLLHAGALHLVMNGLALISVGPVLERWLGRGRFLLLLLASALAGSIASIALHDVPTVGLSGGLFGLLGALFVSTVRYRRAPILGPRLLPRAWVSLIVVNVVISAIPGVDAVAHAAGALAGVGLAMLVTPRLAGDPPRRKKPLVPMRAASVAGFVLAAVYGVALLVMLSRALL